MARPGLALIDSAARALPSVQTGPAIGRSDSDAMAGSSVLLFLFFFFFDDNNSGLKWRVDVAHPIANVSQKNV